MSNKKKRRSKKKGQEEAIGHMTNSLIFEILDDADRETFANNIINPSPPNEKLRNAAEKFLRDFPD